MAGIGFFTTVISSVAALIEEQQIAELGTKVDKIQGARKLFSFSLYVH